MARPTDENPYQSPEFANTAKPAEDEPRHERIIRSCVRRALWQSLSFSVIVMLLLDGGFIARRWAVALTVSWSATVMILLRYKYGRSHVFTQWDAAIVKFGMWPVFILVLVFESAVREMWLRIGLFR
jgi:hypothetical protein